MESGARFCMKIAVDCTTASQSLQKVLAEELPGGEYGVWLATEKPSPRLPEYAFFQPSLGASRAEKSSVFEGLPMKN